MQKTFINSLGMRFVLIDQGSFMMGQDKGGESDERPVHRVNISRPFYMAVNAVTNAQYEQFNPEHHHLRGYNGFSIRDDEAVIFVSWNDTLNFCEWLSKKEGKTYRLPTEAEREYACRAGTTSPYHDGEELPSQHHRHQQMGWTHEPVSLRVGLSPPNAWGLHEMHGNVEEWCLDWYGPYEKEEQIDPLGRESGIFRITRGGSHNTDVFFLRSSNRLAALPDERHWLIGFRLVAAEMPKTRPLPKAKLPPCMLDVSQKTYDWSKGPDEKKPFLKGPNRYVRQPLIAWFEPIFHHNHCPTITWCKNGDLLAAWFSCRSQKGREMVILASRLRAGKNEWDPASLFFKAPDRNMTGSSLFHDGKGRILFLNGMEVAGTWEKLALAMRESTDNGANWSVPRLINPYHQRRNQLIHGMIRTKEGYLIQLCDAVSKDEGGTALYISKDDGKTWDEATNYGWGSFANDGEMGGWIAGIHASVVELKDGSLMALGRGNNINGRMPMSISKDMGQKWTYKASEFPPIGGGQRHILMRLREGPILLISFTDDILISDNKRRKLKGMLVQDASGINQKIYGMFAALSFDEGKTWPIKKPITKDGPPKRFDGGGHTEKFEMDGRHAEPMGYLASTQTPDGVIHLITSALHYQFNLAWLKQPMTESD